LTAFRDAAILPGSQQAERLENHFYPFASPIRGADLALVVERFPEFGRAATCRLLDWAYNNARQFARPDRDWLQP